MSTILVIDDDRTSRRLIAKSLEKLGLQTVECENGRQGWEMLWEDSSIGLVITDMVMPDMDGRELIHLIRHHEEMATLPVIMISGLLSVEEIQPILNISPTNTFFVTKPLDVGLLHKHLYALGLVGNNCTVKQELPH